MQPIAVNITNVRLWQLIGNWTGMTILVGADVRLSFAQNNLAACCACDLRMPTVSA